MTLRGWLFCIHSCILAVEWDFTGERVESSLQSLDMRSLMKRLWSSVELFSEWPKMGKPNCWMSVVLEMVWLLRCGKIIFVVPICFSIFWNNVQQHETHQGKGLWLGWGRRKFHFEVLSTAKLHLFHIHVYFKCYLLCSSLLDYRGPRHKALTVLLFKLYILTLCSSFFWSILFELLVGEENTILEVRFE